MLPLLSDAKRLSERMQQAADRTVRSREDDWIAQEPHFTDRMLARFEDAVNEFEGDGVRWNARTLTDRGPGAEESRLGADFLGVFEATTSGLTFAKGFLSQAKSLENGALIATSEHNRLRQQCRRMLERTPDSFVFLYGSAGVRVVSALAVHSSDQRALDELGTKSVTDFFFDHFQCFIGDASLAAPFDLVKLRPSRLLLPFLAVRRAIVIEAVGQ